MGITLNHNLWISKLTENLKNSKNNPKATKIIDANSRITWNTHFLYIFGRARNMTEFSSKYSESVAITDNPDHEILKLTFKVSICNK